MITAACFPAPPGRKRRRPRTCAEFLAPSSRRALRDARDAAARRWRSRTASTTICANSSRARFAGAESSSLIGKAFSRFMEGEDPTEFSWMEKLGFLAQGIATRADLRSGQAGERLALETIRGGLRGNRNSRRCSPRKRQVIIEPERRAFAIANFFANQLAFRFFTSFVKQLSTGNIIEAIQEISMLLPILGTLAPYLYAFTQPGAGPRAGSRLCRSLAGNAAAPALQNRKRAWFTDTLEDVNGVANTIRQLTAACVAEGHDLTVVTSRPRSTSPISRSRISRPSANSSCRSTSCKSSASRRSCRCSITSSGRASPS